MQKQSVQLRGESHVARFTVEKNSLVNLIFEKSECLSTLGLRPKDFHSLRVRLVGLALDRVLCFPFHRFLDFECLRGFCFLQRTTALQCTVVFSRAQAREKRWRAKGLEPRPEGEGRGDSLPQVCSPLSNGVA